MADSISTSAHGFPGWLEYSSRLREDTELRAHEILRNTHKDYHVTRTSPAKCDLLGYASAGHASAVRDNDETYDALRAYNKPGSRLEKKPGVLGDEVKFGRWSYTWQQNTYLVYQIEFAVPLKPNQKVLFVLSPRSDVTKQSIYHIATDELLLAAGAWSANLHDEIYVFDNSRWTKDKELWKSVQDASWDEVILNQDMKNSLMKDVQGFFDNQQLYKTLGVPWKRGVILHGVPGNGKTISLKALINFLAKRPDPVPSLYVKSFDSCNGPKPSVRSIFTHARKMAPCLLIFEDLDSIVEEKTRSYFLNEVDGLESNDGILMIGSTNHLDKLDPSIAKRPSRFDRKYHFKVPNEEDRAAYSRYWRQKVDKSKLVEFPEALCPIIARLTEGFSFAYLKELFVIALLTIAHGVEDDSADIENVPQSDSSSSSDGVVVDREEATIENGTAEPSSSEDPEKPKSDVSQNGKRTLPHVDIPEALQDNLLLRAIQAQSKILMEEMDNTGEDDAPSSKKLIGGSAPSGVQATMRATR
ncbi:putative ATPase [Lachnellula suecica]|uniref:Putative ATPase n=1 Tax=Lachnellula suecica TaxID=602035 RepID=A0A8T9CIK5_9HELO|nr:putative ATPase [Lachnellula suecica]